MYTNKLIEKIMELLEFSFLYRTIFIKLFITFFFILFFMPKKDNIQIVSDVNINSSINQSEKIEVNDDDIFVDLKGSVLNPGLYEVKSDLLMNDLINLAGGFSNANSLCINLSDKLKGGTIIYVPSKDENCTFSLNTSLIDINNAPLEVLITLKGIGEKRAKDIIEHRNSSKFQEINDIMQIKGIGEKMFENLKDLITV